MRPLVKYTIGNRPVPATRRWIILVAGLLALCLQVMAQILPPSAMQSVMQTAALQADEAQSFTATCLNLGLRNDGQPAKPDNHASCPVCLTLLQVQGFAAAPVEFPVSVAWAYQPWVGMAVSTPAAIASTASFASRAPPASALA